MQTRKRFRGYPTPSQEQIRLQWIGHQRFIYNARCPRTGITGPLPKKRSLFREPPFPSIRNMPGSSDRTPPGSGRFPPRYSVTGRFAGNRRLDVFFFGLAKRPVFQRKNERQSVWITSELFRFRSNDQTQFEGLILGTKKFPLGVLSFKAHTPYCRPASLLVSVEAGRWFVSFS